VTSRRGRSPIRIGNFQNWIKFEKSQKTDVKNKKHAEKNKTNAIKNQNKRALDRVIPWEMGPHFPEKKRLGLGLAGCANHQPFLENLCSMQGQKPKPN